MQTDPSGIVNEFDRIGYYKDIHLEINKVIPEKETAVNMELVARDLFDIVCDTELPEKFPVVEITNVKNENVEKKYQTLLSIEALKDAPLIPPFMLAKDPLSFDEEVIKKAPWVNDIHAWMKVYNVANTLSAIQRGFVDAGDVTSTVLSLSEQIYSFTTECDGTHFTRTSNQFRNQSTFPETVERKAGTEGVNAVRHVSLAEMRYTFQVLRAAFTKKDS